VTTASNLLAFVGLVVTLAIVWRQSWPGRLRLFAAQSLVLAALAGTLGLLAGRPRLLLVALVFLVVKAVVIPRVLRRIGAGMPVRPVTPGKSSGVALLVAGGLFAGSVQDARAEDHGTSPPAQNWSFSGPKGTFDRGHILGFLVFENGIFGLALLATYGLPGIVEAGVFLDVLVIVLIMEAVVGEVRREHESIDEQRLRELRE